MQNAQLIAGVPVPKSARELLIVDGVTHPPQALRDPAFRAANNIVEIVPQQIDRDYAEAGDLIGHVNQGGGVYQEVRAVAYRSMPVLAAKKIAAARARHDQAVYGGITYDQNDYAINNTVLLKTIGNRGRARAATEMITIAGDIVTFTPAQFAAFDAAISDHVNDAHDNLIAHIRAIKALADTATPEQMIAYDVTTGWPVNPPAVTV